MKVTANKLLVLWLITSSNITFAKSVWQCFAFNRLHQSYQGKGLHLKSAMHNAKVKCMTSNRQNGPCQTAHSFCERQEAKNYSNCQITDNNGKTFRAKQCQQALIACRVWHFKNSANDGSGCMLSHKAL